MIKAIIFDYGNVLGNDTDAWDTNFADLIEEIGIDRQKLDQIWAGMWPLIKVGEMSIYSFWEEVYKFAPNKIPVGEMIEKYLHRLTLDREMIALAYKLRDRGYKIAILANETRLYMEYKIELFSLRDLTEDIYGSAHLGMAKPNPAVYKRVLGKLQVKPQEALFIDNLERNTSVAEEIGMHAIVFTTLQELQERMEPLLAK